ncbi:MAG TPA: NAD(P)-binding domain-containing protein [Terriglobales bacterium]|nr:NAD(P)-binding domain-containing protein [Terriglobales bacterium]
MKATVFLGGGRITAALLAGLRLAGHKAPIIVHDRNAHKLRALKKEFGVGVEPDLLSAVARARLLIVAVRPSDVAGLLEILRESTVRNKPGLVVCSLSAGIPTSNLRGMLGPPVRWARAMPSPVARVGRGLTAVTFQRNLARADRRMVREFFAEVGEVIEIPESVFDAFTVTYSASHGYHALATLAQSAETLGLDRKTAFTAAAHALGDAIVSWRGGEDTLDALLHEAATPGGIAATVMHSMDAAGYSRIIQKALGAGVERARKNAKGLKASRAR